MRQYSAYLKRMARSALKGKYGLFIAFLILVMLVSAIAESIPSSLFGAPSSLPLFLSQLLVSFMISVLVNMLNVGLAKLALNHQQGAAGRFWRYLLCLHPPSRSFSDH